jgi:hypothetical protein
VTSWAGHISRWRVFGRVLFALIAIYAANDGLLHAAFAASSDEVTVGAPLKAARFALLKPVASADDDERHAVHPDGLPAEVNGLAPQSLTVLGGSTWAPDLPPSAAVRTAFARGPPSSH